MFCGLDELVGDVVVDPDIAHTKGQHSQRVLVVVGQRAMADCAGEERSQMAVFHPTVPAFSKMLCKRTLEMIWKYSVSQEDPHCSGNCLTQNSQVMCSFSCSSCLFRCASSVSLLWSTVKLTVLWS